MGSSVHIALGEQELKICVIGAAGGIGSVLSDKLVQNPDIELVLIDDLSSGLRDNFDDPRCSENLIVADIRYDRERIEPHLANANVIIHLAAVSSLVACQLHPSEAFETNFSSTVWLAELSRRSGIHFIFASTSAVYERSTSLPFKEDLEVFPELTYSLSKKISEDFLENQFKLSGFPSTVIRFFNVFGPRQDLQRPNPPFVNYLIREIANNRTPKVYAPPQQTRDYVYVDDLVDLILKVVESGPNGFTKINACSGIPISIRDILDAVMRGLGQDFEFEQCNPEALWENFNDLFNGTWPLPSKVVRDETLKTSVGDPALAKALFGWQVRFDVLESIESHAREIFSRALTPRKL